MFKINQKKDEKATENLVLGLLAGLGIAFLLKEASKSTEDETQGQ